MFGHWLLGLKDEYLRKSKKELVDEIMRLKFELSAKSKEEMTQVRFKTIYQFQLENDIKNLKEDLEVWKKKYADELQKRLELAKIVEELEHDN